MNKIDVEKLREDFPILQREVYGKPLIYLDNAATTQKPSCVVEAMRDQYYTTNANVHRGTHFLSIRATELMEKARETMRQFINAQKTNEIIFTRGTTESINLLAASYGEGFMKEGDEVILSPMEHHSNIVPWQLLAKRRGIYIKTVPLNHKGELIISECEKLINGRTKLISLSHVSNAMGTLNQVEKITMLGAKYNVPVHLDGAQAIQHMKVDVSKLGVDFYSFSGHKMYGPTGIGVLYGKEKWLERMPPYQGGGEMIKRVSFQGTTYNELPYKFEAGTPDYVAITGLAKAAEYLTDIGFEAIAEHEDDLLQYTLTQLKGIEKFVNYSRANKTCAVLSFLLRNIHHFDIGTLLDRQGIAVRTGHHCAQPLMDHFKITGTVRVSFGLYNTRQEADALVKAVRRIAAIFGNH